MHGLYSYENPHNKTFRKKSEINQGQKNDREAQEADHQDTRESRHRETFEISA